MIVEIEEESRDFVTVFKKDYLGGRVERPTECRPLPTYPPPLNILNGPYRLHLNTQLENQSLPESERSEDPVDNLNRMRDKFPHLRNALPQVVPDENIIEREKEKSKRTVYQLGYSKKLDRYDRDVTLPEDWVILETMQKRAYRDPWTIAARELIKPPKILRPRNNLDPNLKEREILRVTTGNSEYISTTGATGERIALRGLLDVTRRVRLQKPLKNLEISDSECSLILKQNLVLPSKII
ncbi:uncharacterized protein [Linepithema humile]|uniref:uncharacterized protein n=1 Tax=Linepithema humile TaxID=83485 RepID=UPI00351E3A65